MVTVRLYLLPLLSDDSSDDATVDFDSFLKVLNRPGGFREPGEPEEYCRGFQVFDKDMSGFIGVGQLRYSMSLSCLSLLLYALLMLDSPDQPRRENVGR